MLCSISAFDSSMSVKNEKQVSLDASDFFLRLTKCNEIDACTRLFSIANKLDREQEHEIIKGRWYSVKLFQ